jgi:branched-chain amino acid transport system ATP-binding protein
MLELRQVSAGYGRLPVLFDLDLTIAEGEMVGLVGQNGAGKSTTLNTILGTVRSRAGDIVFGGQRITHLSPHARVDAGITLSLEGRRIFKSLTVRDNLLAGAHGLRMTEVAAQMDVCFDLFPVLAQRSTQRAGSLSGGEQQMLAISRALMHQPRLLLVDELSMGLAPLVVKEILACLRRLCDEGLSVLVVEQHPASLVGVADRGLVMSKGRITFAGSAAEAGERMKAHMGARRLVS